MGSGQPGLQYHCVAVVAGAHPCNAAMALKGRRILSAEAPRLPLATCDRPGDCQCSYHKFGDRRVGPRRAGERGMLAAPWVNTERRRRGTAGRRESDFR